MDVYAVGWVEGYLNGIRAAMDVCTKFAAESNDDLRRVVIAAEIAEHLDTMLDHYPTPEGNIMSTPNEDVTKQAGAANGTKTTTPQGQEAINRRVETHGTNTDITGTQVDPKSNADLTNEDGTVLYPHPEKSHFSGPAPAEIDPAAGSSPHSPNHGKKETH